MTIHAGTTIDMYLDALLIRWHMRLRAWSGRMGNLPIHIYGYNNEHDVIVYTVVKDTQSECGHRFQKSPFWSVYTETQPQSFQTKRGLQRFQKSQFSTSKTPE